MNSEKWINTAITSYTDAFLSRALHVCLLQALVKPQIGSSAFGELGVTLWAFRAGLRLTAYILTVSFPTKADIYFSKFPLDVR